ncbi:hypothetical protein WMY93_016506 [Mugilogobius chulae]|uniref:Uncharacterized protein n=1 Tax=Mugilogobius chulae TaxID=88201 RepID=A0AAW0NPV7_9GOBI
MLEPYYDREQLDKPSPDQGAVLALSIAPATDSPLPLSNSLQVSDSVSLSGAEDGPCAQMNNHEEMAEQMKNGEGSVCPSKRWNHAMCLIDPDTAVLIGGETSGQNYSKDPFWKLELDSDFWFPMDSFSSEHVPLCSRGHTGLSYNELYILNTLTWKWTLVKTKGSVPTLAYHSACIYKKELFVFGGIKPSTLSGENFAVMPCTYSTQSLDCGLMEYAAVKCENIPPLPRGFHAAVSLSDNRILLSGGCSAIGVFQDVHIFDLDTRTWTSFSSVSFFQTTSWAQYNQSGLYYFKHR